MVIYFHGLNGAASDKRLLFERTFEELLGSHENLLLPQYHDGPSYLAAIDSAMDAIRKDRGGPYFIVGTSLGGFAALLTAQRWGSFASLINPCLCPGESLREKVDPDWLQILRTLEAESISQKNMDSDGGYKAYINRDDEVLYPFADALRRVEISDVVEFPAGGHRASNFESEILPKLIADYRWLEECQKKVREAEQWEPS